MYYIISLVGTVLLLDLYEKTKNKYKILNLFLYISIIIYAILFL